MRPAIHLMTAMFVALLSQTSAAQATGGRCADKRAEISRNLDAARAQGQTRQIRGLEKALREVQEHCSDAVLERAHAKRIAKQEKKVAERRRDLEKAQRQGKAEKIAERQQKLAREEAELAQLRAGQN